MKRQMFLRMKLFLIAAIFIPAAFGCGTSTDKIAETEDSDQKTADNDDDDDDNNNDYLQDDDDNQIDDVNDDKEDDNNLTDDDNNDTTDDDDNNHSGTLLDPPIHSSIDGQYEIEEIDIEVIQHPANAKAKCFDISGYNSIRIYSMDDDFISYATDRNGIWEIILIHIETGKGFIFKKEGENLSEPVINYPL